MSLLVWLPLNGDLHNLGLRNILFINNGATTNTEGKIGSCYSFNGSSNYLKTTYNFYNSKYSICAWIYSTSSSATQTICCNRTAVGSGFSTFLIGGKLRIDSGGNNLLWTTNYTYPINTWFHLAITYDGSKVSYYINGVYKESKAQAISSSYWTSTTSIGVSLANNSNYGNYLNGRLNDIRIYNHCLSAKEIEEISKGLVLHYPLNRLSLNYPYTRENLFLGSGYTVADLAGFVANSSTDWTKYFRFYNGSASIHSFSDDIDTITLNSTANLGIAFVRKATDINLDSTQYYTISCEAKCTKSGAKLGIGISYYTNGNSWTWRGGSNLVAFTAVDTWQTFTLTFKPDANTQYICYCFTCNNGASGGTDTMSIRHCKLEKGSTATPWNLNPKEAAYGILTATPPTICFDSSGYGNNGTIYDAKTSFDSLRYDSSLAMLGTTVDLSSNTITGAQYITGSLNLTAPSALTVSWWGKNIQYGRGGIFLTTNNTDLINTSDHSSTAIANWDSNFRVYNGSSAINIFNNFVKDGNWHHHVITYDGVNVKYYCDNILKLTGALTGTLPTFKGFCMGLGKAGGVYRQIKLNINDLRIYITALTESLIQELYKNSMLVNGTNIVPRNLE